MSASVRWDGLDAFREAMRNLPRDLTAEAHATVHEAADGAEAEIYAAYGEKSGNLRRGLKQEPAVESPFGIAIRLKNTAKHAWLWDHGTEARHYFTRGGAQHDTGAMWGRTTPPFTFIRGAMKWRRWMMDRHKAMLEAHGLIVKGDDDA